MAPNSTPVVVTVLKLDPVIFTCWPPDALPVEGVTLEIVGAVLGVGEVVGGCRCAAHRGRHDVPR